jgi:hypothetical protein
MVHNVFYCVKSDEQLSVMVINRNATGLFLFVRLPPYIGAGGVWGCLKNCITLFLDVIAYPGYCFHEESA